MHAFDVGAAGRARRFACAAPAPARQLTTLDGDDAHARRHDAGHRRPRTRRSPLPASWAAPPSEVSSGTTTRGARERVVRARVRPGDQPQARPQDRSVGAVRARRRSHGPRARSAPRAGVDRTDRRRHGRRRHLRRVSRGRPSIRQVSLSTRASCTPAGRPRARRRRRADPDAPRLRPDRRRPTAGRPTSRRSAWTWPARPT